MMLSGRVALAVAIGAGLVACAAPVPEDAPIVDASELMEADRAFNRAVSEGGSAAWATWFAEDGAMVQETVGEIRGRAAIADAVAFLDLPGVSLTWDPIRADIARSGDLGWTTGSFVSVSPAEDGSERRDTGTYVSIWRRQADGTWKVVMDLGNPTSE